MAIDANKKAASLVRGHGNLTGAAGLAVIALFVVPLSLIAFRLSTLPGSDAIGNLISLTGLHEDVSQQIEIVVFLPLAALLIVVFRVMLGIRVLGPFRSILLAVAFQVTGITIGLIFLTLVVLVIVAVRPFLREIRLPYFARVAASLSIVVIMIVLVLVVARWMSIHSLTSVAYFPIVVLCLTGDGFARTIHREGITSAIWRGSMTALTAVIIAGLASVELLAGVMMHFPELILVQIGLIIIVSEYFGFRLLAPLNPPPRKRQGKDRGKRKPYNQLRKSEQLPSRRLAAAAGLGFTRQPGKTQPHNRK
ncbi:MAG: hypothetical protein JSU74_00155 [Candidatus Zixiibacteriota bacterium]|nr:MAG: hypothetical protein JSU74_00155 [candidate division Zixibacteria bacterium]